MIDLSLLLARGETTTPRVWKAGHQLIVDAVKRFREDDKARVSIVLLYYILSLIASRLTWEELVSLAEGSSTDVALARLGQEQEDNNDE
jgi:hypothetical protein